MPSLLDPKGNYRIEGPAFIYSDRQTRRVSTILGYPTYEGRAHLRRSRSRPATIRLRRLRPQRKDAAMV